MDAKKTQIPEYTHFAVLDIFGDIVRVCITEELRQGLLRKPVDFQLLLGLTPVARVLYHEQTGFTLDRSWVIEACNIIDIEARDFDKVAVDSGRKP